MFRQTPFPTGTFNFSERDLIGCFIETGRQWGAIRQRIVSEWQGLNASSALTKKLCYENFISHDITKMNVKTITFIQDVALIFSLLKFLLY